VKLHLLRLPVLATVIASTFVLGFKAEAHTRDADATIASIQRGQASWYGPGFHGRRTANGEVFNSQALTAAHRSLPFGTRVRVVNEKTGRSVIVRINDRGPFAKGRVIDLAHGAAKQIGMAGVARVSIHAVN
jgi:rare lipoprotein A